MSAPDVDKLNSVLASRLGSTRVRAVHDEEIGTVTRSIDHRVDDGLIFTHAKVTI